MTELESLGIKIRQTINTRFTGPDAEKPLKLILFDVSWLLTDIQLKAEAAEKSRLKADETEDAEAQLNQGLMF